MNVLFLTLMRIRHADERGIYPDLIKEFARHNHHVYVVTPHEKAEEENYIARVDEGNIHIIQARINNYYNQGSIKKGISTVTLSTKYIRAIESTCSSVRFHLILYSTPPITFNKVIRKYKNRDKANTYLLLKDIWPQGPVDMGALTTTGVKGYIYRYFRSVEKRLYSLSDRIGCMSQANVEYVKKHNLEIDPEIIELCPNSIEVVDKSVDEETKKKIRDKYGIPLDKKAFIYGGNLGKPQGIPFLIDCLKACSHIKDAFFLIIGSGTEYGLLEKYEKTAIQRNFKLMNGLPKDDYDCVVGACDVGLIFLDHRFTIPNFPSRLLSYMQAKLPVIACTDVATDIGKVITLGGFGWWCESDNVNAFLDTVKSALVSDTSVIGNNGFKYLCDNYTVEISYSTIMKRLNGYENINSNGRFFSRK